MKTHYLLTNLKTTNKTNKIPNLWKISLKSYFIIFAYAYFDCNVFMCITCVSGTL